MTRTTLAIVVAAAGLGGCIPARMTEDGMFDPEVMCRDRIVNVNHARGFLLIRPNFVEVCRNRVIRLRIDPPIDVGMGRTIPDDSAQAWLQRSNASPNEILIEVPGNAPLNETFEYTLQIDGVGTLDPYVRIIF
ncbi:MAG TPA: hypothetical protein VLD39_13145 [Gammaproteobacteria bacterium]|nr:hypothetical protein [Gammaproteobacteria bacterium]